MTSCKVLSVHRRVGNPPCIYVGLDEQQPQGVVREATIARRLLKDRAAPEVALKEGNRVDFTAVVRALTGKPATEANGDIVVLSWARKEKLGLAEIIPERLHLLKVALDDRERLLDGTADERFLKVAAICDKLHHSRRPTRHRKSSQN
jgi:hypothetical protein